MRYLFCCVVVLLLKNVPVPVVELLVLLSTDIFSFLGRGLGELLPLLFTATLALTMYAAGLDFLGARRSLVTLSLF